MNNCLFFALKKFLKKDGFIIIRKSNHGKWFHFMWSKNLKDIEHFVPHEKLKCALFSKILFKGKVKKYKHDPKKSK